MWGLELDWTRCPDGVGMVDIAAPKPGGKRLIAAGGGGRYFAAKTKRRVPIKLRLDNLESPISVALANANTDEKLADFFGRYGLLDPAAEPALYDNAVAVRDQVNILLARASLGAVVAANSINRELGRHKAVVTPRLDNSRIRLAASDLIAFMLMEVAAVAETGAEIFACERCGKQFLTGPRTGRRSTARFCSDKCRTYAFRERNRAV